MTVARRDTSCGAAGPGRRASRMPSHSGTGPGAENRAAVAYGMPRNAAADPERSPPARPRRVATTAS
jgi:hypothetical protein